MKPKYFGVLVLVLACLHEFLWWWLKDYAPGEAGSIRAVLRWPLIAVLCYGLAKFGRDKWLAGVCVAVAFFSATSSACELAWLLDPWPFNPDDELCSKKWGVPMTLVSAFVALVTVARWQGDE